MMESVVSRQIFFEAGPALVETTYSSYVRTLPSRTYVSKQKVICTYVRTYVRTPIRILRWRRRYRTPIFLGQSRPMY